MGRALVRATSAGAIGWLAFAFRFRPGLQNDFQNDHFEHLSMARQVLFGELPGRDFIDPGRPLTVLLSAGAQALFGHSLFGEALLAIGALALGAAITFWLASGLSRSILAGVLAALLVIAITPRLYSYPKVIVFAVALLALWRYIDRPSVARAVVLAAATMFALLMRHDFGVYVGVVSICSIAMVRLNPYPPVDAESAFRRTSWRPIAAYVIGGAVLAAPYLFWMQQNGLLASTAASGTGSLAGAVGVTWRPLHFDRSHGFVHLDPVRGEVTVRWSAATAVEDRTSLEQRHGLIQPRRQNDTTWSYGITDDSRDNLRALVSDPHVDDTGGINRGAATLDVPAWRRWLSRLGVSRLIVGPFFTSEDAEAWIYAFFWLIPLAALGLVAFDVRRGSRLVESDPQVGLSDSLKVASAALLGVGLNLFLLRGSLDSRLPDVVVPHAVAGAWLIATTVRRSGKETLHPRLFAVAAVAVVFALLSSAVLAYSRVSVSALVRGAVRPKDLGEVARSLRQRPIEAWAASDTGIRRLTRYVFECTTPQDRLLLVAYQPEVFYYAERLFAGGVEYFHQRRFSSPTEQAGIVAALERQRVPLVIVEDDRLRMLEEDYTQVFTYIRGRYAPAAHTTFGTERGWRIYADRALAPPGKLDELPCYR